jgi:hypothetical protein
MVAQAYESIDTVHTPDVNSGNVLGYSEAVQSTYDGKIMFDNNRVTGVQCCHNAEFSSVKHVTARKEVFVCGGVQGSAKLLLLRYVFLINIAQASDFIVALDRMKSLQYIKSHRSSSFRLEIIIQTTPFSLLLGSFETEDYPLVICHWSLMSVTGLQVCLETGWRFIDKKMIS